MVLKNGGRSSHSYGPPSFFSIRFIFSSKGESEHLGGLKGQETKLKNKVSNNI